MSGRAAPARRRNGIVCNANIPTEEVFTAPHKDKVDGTVCSSKPLSYQGSLIDGIKVRFEKRPHRRDDGRQGRRRLPQPDLHR